MTDGVKTFVQSVAVLLVLVTGGGIWQWPRLHQWQIEGDLRDYARTARKSDLVLHQKEQLLDAIDRLQDRLEQGETIGFFRWRRCDEAVRDLTRAGITSDEVKLIVRELHRIESKLNQ